MFRVPPKRFQVHMNTGRTPDTDAWQLLDMAQLYNCILGFTFDHRREVFLITDLDGRIHSMGIEQVRRAYSDAVVGMVDSLLEADTSGGEWTTETGVRSNVEAVPYVLDPLDRKDIYPQHWTSPHTRPETNRAPADTDTAHYSPA